MDISERIKKYGPAWRYVQALERELDKRQRQYIAVRILFATNVLLIAAVVWLWSRP